MMGANISMIYGSIWRVIDLLAAGRGGLYGKPIARSAGDEFRYAGLHVLAAQRQ